MSEKSLWEDLVLLPAQLASPPLFSSAEADTGATVGKNALIPLHLEIPVIAAHMSYGSVPDEFKIAAARAASRAGIAGGSGDGGVMEEEMELSSSYIYEYTPELYGLTPEVLERCSAVEIKIGQGAKGGLGENIPNGLSERAYHMRGIEPTAFFTSAGRFDEITSSNDLKIIIEGLREGSGGKPVGVKIAAGHIEEDLDMIIEAGADFVDIDGQNAGCWQEISVLKNSGLPTLYALSRAKKHIQRKNADLDIIVGGGIRNPSEIAKALALGASAVVMGSALLSEARLNENRELTLSPLETEEKLYEFFNQIKSDLAIVCAYTGHSGISQLSEKDLAAVTYDLSRRCGIEHI